MSEAPLSRLLEPTGGLRLCWLGNLSWLLGDGERLIAFDLDLETDTRVQSSPISTSELAPHLDIHFVTHWHGDHFSGSTCPILAQHSECLFVLPANCLDKAREMGIPEGRVQVARPDEPFDLDGGLHVEPQRALHGDKSFAVYRHANLEDCGYLFDFGGKRILQPGDTVLLQQHLELEAVQVLFVSPTVHNTYIDRSVTLINQLEPEYVFPQHFGTYREAEDNLFWTRGYPDELKSALPPKLRPRFHKLHQGQVFEIVAARARGSD